MPPSALEDDRPLLFLSARDTELDKVVGLEIGGAMTTWRSPSACESSSHASAPCCAADRAATSRALTTPSPPAVSSLDEDATASGANGEIDLTPREFEVACQPSKNAGKVVSSEICCATPGVGNT